MHPTVFHLSFSNKTNSHRPSTRTTDRPSHPTQGFRHFAPHHLKQLVGVNTKWEWEWNQLPDPT